MSFCSVRNRITFREDSSVGLRKLAPSGVHLDRSHGLIFSPASSLATQRGEGLKRGVPFLFLAFCGSLF